MPSGTHLTSGGISWRLIAPVLILSRQPLTSNNQKITKKPREQVPAAGLQCQKRKVKVWL